MRAGNEAGIVQTHVKGIREVPCRRPSLFLEWVLRRDVSCNPSFNNHSKSSHWKEAKCFSFLRCIAPSSRWAVRATLHPQSFTVSLWTRKYDLEEKEVGRRGKKRRQKDWYLKVTVAIKPFISCRVLFLLAWHINSWCRMSEDKKTKKDSESFIGERKWVGERGYSCLITGVSRGVVCSWIDSLVAIIRSGGLVLFTIVTLRR